MKRIGREGLARHFRRAANALEGAFPWVVPGKDTATPDKMLFLDRIGFPSGFSPAFLVSPCADRFLALGTARLAEDPLKRHTAVLVSGMSPLLFNPEIPADVVGAVSFAVRSAMNTGWALSPFFRAFRFSDEKTWMTGKNMRSDEETRIVSFRRGDAILVAPSSRAFKPFFLFGKPAESGFRAGRWMKSDQNLLNLLARHSNSKPIFEPEATNLGIPLSVAANFASCIKKESRKGKK